MFPYYTPTCACRSLGYMCTRASSSLCQRFFLNTCMVFFVIFSYHIQIFELVRTCVCT